MPHLLKNKTLEILIDLPSENYQLSRFDWTGKIVDLKYRGKYLSGAELVNKDEHSFCGKGFYNEFGINTPIGFDDIGADGWFHKIGIGLLKREAGPYDFSNPYEIRPAQFKAIKAPNKIQIFCSSESYNGYAYVLEKEIELLENGFKLSYLLQNKGSKPIITEEYNHNFLSIDGTSIGSDYILKFPFQIKPALFEETVNPDNLVDIGQKEIKFRGNPQSPFFFSKLSGSEAVVAKWSLENRKCGIGISETGNFQTRAVNLWGCGHVISPELFYYINIQPRQASAWNRSYTIYEID